MWWIDVIFIAVIVIFAIIGLAKGLFESILQLLSTGVSVGLAVWLARPASTLINKILPFVKWYTSALKSQPDPIVIFGHELSHEKVAAFLSIVTAGVIIFILSKLIIWLLAKLFDSATKNSTALSGLNRVFGLFFGAARGILMAVAILATISLISEVPFMEKVSAKVQDSTVTGWVYKYVDDFVDKNLTKANLDEILDKVVDSATKKDEGAKSSNAAVIYNGTTADGLNYQITL